MAIDASIPLGVKPVQIESPLNSLAQVAQLQGAQTQNSLLGLKMQQAQQDQRERDAIRTTITGLPATATDDQRIAALRGSGTQAGFTMADTLETSLMNRKKTEAAAAKDQLEAAHQRVELLGSGSAWLRQNPTPENALSFAQHLHDSGVITPEQFQASVAKIKADPSPQAIAQGADMAYRTALSAKDQLPKIETQSTGGALTTQAVDPVTGKPTVTGSTPMTATPGETTTDARERERMAQTERQHQETLKKDYIVAGLNPDGTPRQMPVAADGSLDLTKVSPEDLAAAHRYRADGTLPPNMGRGAQGAMESRRIRAIATALDAQAGESPEDARQRQLAMKGDVQAVAALRKREVAIGANVKNFDFNADQVLQLSGKLDRTGVPIVNAWINAGRRAVSGNPELAAFDTAVKTTVNEFAQIVGGTTSGASTEGEKKKAEALLNAQQTPEQIVAVINQMRIESKNRMESFARQRQESMPTNAARPSAQAGGAPLVNAQGWTLHTDPKGVRAYVSPDGKQFQLVK